MVQHSGGKLLGKGSYGCVFKPPFFPNSGVEYIDRGMFDKHARDMTLVGKLLSIEHCNKELGEGERVKKLDPEMSFSIQPLGSVTLTRKDIVGHDEDDKRKCNHLSFENHPTAFPERMKQIYYADGGKDLQYYMFEKGLDDPRLLVDKILVASLPIWKGIRRMQLSNAFHSDIKGGNVVYNVDRNIMRLIDFGMLQSSERALIRHFTHEEVLSWKYDTYPIELQIMSYLKYQSQHVTDRGHGRVKKMSLEKDARKNTVKLYTDLRIPHCSTADAAKRHIEYCFDNRADFETRFWKNLRRIDECSFALTIGVLITNVFGSSEGGVRRISPVANSDLVYNATDTLTKMCLITYFMDPVSLLDKLIAEITQISLWGKRHGISQPPFQQQPPKWQRR